MKKWENTQTRLCDIVVAARIRRQIPTSISLTPRKTMGKFDEARTVLQKSEALPVPIRRIDAGDIQIRFQEMKNLCCRDCKPQTRRLN
ncbi:MAG: hypothetical protein LBR98_01360 [Syntrophomonadaceae bacterium]|nr:hypothetical protein [Syntrophomonadaceae bacterium]